MGRRKIAFLGLAIIAFNSIGWGAVVQDQDTDSLRASYEGQFESFDINSDGELDEAEVGNVPDSDLADMHAHGLPASIPVSREAFVASGVATALAAIAGSDAPKKVMEDKVIRESVKTVKEELTKDKPTETKVTGAAVPAVSRLPGRKSHYVPELPAEFAARDKNGDGQIALYEWDRKKYSEFAKLDKNGDGFLTPAELLPAEALKTLYAKVTGRTAAPVPAGSTGANPASPVPGGTPGDELDKEARNVLGQMDQNKNGMIDEDEWSRSTRIRPSFERAGIKVSIPINADTFVQHYRRSKEAERTERR